MDLKEGIQYRLDGIFKRFLEAIADQYSIDLDELCAFVNSIDLETGKEVEKVMTCMHKITRGANRGQFCPVKAMSNGYCGKHQGSASTAITRATKTVVEKKPKMTKTQQQIIEWLNTATPKEETVLKKTSKGLIHEETELVFDEEYMVIGRLNNDKINKLAHFQVELCEKHGWYYDETMVESDESLEE